MHIMLVGCRPRFMLTYSVSHYTLGSQFMLCQFLVDELMNFELLITDNHYTVALLGPVSDCSILLDIIAICLSFANAVSAGVV